MPPIACVLLDVGGTLWPQRGQPPDPAIRIQRLTSALPSLGTSGAKALLSHLNAADRLLIDGGPQDVKAFLRDVAFAAGLDLTADEVDVLRQALCLPAASAVSLFPGAEELLLTIRRLSLPCAIVSNADVRSGDDYRRDFDSFGVAHLVDAYISSIDVGMRKPHPKPFLVALEQLRCTPDAAVVVGDSERNDIEPARRLGARSILVAIESAVPERSVADAVATNLKEVAKLVETWTA